MEETWNGFRRLDFTFEGRSAILVLPEKQDKWGNFAMKTEYWDAFPGTEIALLKEGFALAYLKNANRWATPEDCHVRARFVRELSERYGLRDRCVPVGMSCGGAHAVQFAGLHPECVQALFLDAPVLNFCSCPAYLGRQDRLDGALEKEFFAAYPEMTRPQLLSFPRSGNTPRCRRNNPDRSQNRSGCTRQCSSGTLSTATGAATASAHACRRASSLYLL